MTKVLGHGRLMGAGVRSSAAFLVVCAFACSHNKESDPLVCVTSSESSASVSACTPATRHGIIHPGFHGGGPRLGWDDQETELMPANVGGGHFGLLWSSAPFDPCGGYPARMYASPLYADDITIRGGAFDGVSLSVVFAATSNGTVYAMNAFLVACSASSIPAGAILWRSQLVAPSVVPGLDGGVPLGILSTPALDVVASRLYVTGMDRPNGGPPVWKVFALDASSGVVLPGWPVVLDGASIEAVDTNGPQPWEPDATQLSQRSALALSPSADRLYVSFGGYSDSVTGWMVSVDTARAKVVASFSAAHNARLGDANAGLWGMGGAAVDANGVLFMTTGNSPALSGGVAGTWGDSLLAWDADLSLRGTYSPWNYCNDDAYDADIGGDSPILLPDQSPSGTSTPRLVAFGSKQGTVYLLERSALPGSVTTRSVCVASPTWRAASSDSSLLPPPGATYCDPQEPAQCVRGPLSVFGPYSDAPHANEDDRAKMRSTPAYFGDASGAAYLFVSGTTKGGDGTNALAPSLARLQLHLSAGQPAYLGLDAMNRELSLLNPGSPVVTSAAGTAPVVWIVDENAQRTQPLAGASPRPVLYAVDGKTLAVLYRSAGNDLTSGGKYVEPLIAHGAVFVGTDRMQAFGVRR